MRVGILSLTLLLAVSVPLLGQSGSGIPASPAAELQSPQSAMTQEQSSYPIPGSHLLWEQSARLARLAAQHPEMMPAPALRKTAWSFTVGSTRNWYADDFVTSARYQVPSTCKAVGTNSYIFVEDSSWAKGYITQTMVDSMAAAFDLRTPADPSKGIYTVNTQTFGNPPDVDGDARIIILMLDIRDGWSGTGGYVAGYFYSYNQYAVSPSTPTSNVAEIYFLDCYPANLSTPGGLQQGLATTAHEFQHMIHFNYDQNEIVFVNESCSEAAEVVNGYNVYNQSYFTSEPNHFLFDWRYNDNTKVLRDYSRAARYSLYLRDQFGASVFKPIVASGSTGSAGIDAGLTAFGTARRFTDILEDWFIANILDDTTVNARYGYKYPGLAKVTGRTYAVPSVPLTSDTIQALAADYISFVAGSDLRATFTWSSPSVKVRAVKIGSGGKQVVNVASGVEFHEPTFGTTYTQIHFVVSNTSPSANAIVTYQATGPTSAIELKYDNGTPTGYLGLMAGDTVAVWFNAVPGGMLDSVRVALRRAGTMTGGVYEYSGALRPTPLGKALATGLTASISTTPGVPYPVPWTNWAKIDLTSQNIPTDNAFAVAFVCAGDPSTTPRVMSHETWPTPSPITSYTYYLEAGAGANWYYLSAGTDSVHTYMIRAYVGFRSVTPLTVYPGDANNDGGVDARDILPIGRFYGKTGAVRSGASLTWSAQSVPGTWSPPEAAYADCDGNGTVNANDVQGLIDNWGNTVGGPVGSRDPLFVCEELLKMIDAQGRPAGAMLEIRNAIVAYMHSALGVTLSYSLEQNWPNPFNPSTTIRFTIPQDVTNATLVVFNVIGQAVWTKEFGSLFTGSHSVSWDGRTNDGAAAASGIYIYQLTAGPYRSAKRMALIK